VDELEEEVMQFLLEGVQGREELLELVREFNDCRTKEAKIVKFADILDAFAHARVRIWKTFDRYLTISKAKLRRFSPEHDEGIGNQLSEWLDQIVEEWDAVEPSPIA
jgi:5'-deoxynucleotidase YfbR-like HD superfamily hydrolase